MRINLSFQKMLPLLLILLLGLALSIIALLKQTHFLHYASTISQLEPENGILSGNISVGIDSSASGGKYVQFPAANGLPSACKYPYKRLVKVTTTAGLNNAVAAALPGDMIVMADGTYAARTTITVSGTSADRITLCGNRAAKIAGSNIASGDVVALKANYWNLSGFTAIGSVLGIHIFGGNFNDINGLEVYGVGQEAIEANGFSSDNTIENNYIHDTGLYIAEYGEGVYLGTAQNNWCTYSNCQPDTSNRNQVVGNIFGTNVTAENLDIKEGTTGGLVSNNTFNGLGQATTPDFLDSWVDVKGSHYTISNNTGSTTRRYGFEVNKQVNGTDSGDYNTFNGNSMNLNGGQYGIKIGYGSPIGTVVKCNNTVTNATIGLTNITCQP